MCPLPVGKLPPALLERLLQRHASQDDPRLLLGPGIGLDCAVVDFGDRVLVAKSDPITFTAENIGWYAVNVNANDVVTTGAPPAWFLATLLLPEGAAEEADVEAVFAQIAEACRSVGARFVGGHTEVTAGLDRTILMGTMLGETTRDRLVTPRGARPGDRLLLTKGVPIEATSILAQDFTDQLQDLGEDLLARARRYLTDPGISVVREALAAVEAGGVSAMHDPTEGGLAAGLWELARAADVGLVIDLEAVPIPPEAAVICERLRIDPLAAIASGALLLAVRSEAVDRVLEAIEAAGVSAAVIGEVVQGEGVLVRRDGHLAPLPWPERDALAALFEAE